MATQVSYEPPAKKAKRNSEKFKPKLKNLSKDELGELLADILTRLEELEK